MSMGSNLYEQSLQSKHFEPATIEYIQKDSPAQRAHLKVGDRVVYVNGTILNDMIEWFWQTDGEKITLGVLSDAYDQHNSCSKKIKEVTLKRDLYEDWGIEFDRVVFDGIKTCRNACTFCFMRMLPDDARPSLFLKDDDYRLSFLQGNFVTLTNVSDDEVERIINYQLSPINVSLHAVSDSVREQLIGRNHKRGIEVLEKLLLNGIEIHAQIVLVPDVNDGAELLKTLDFIQSHSNIKSVAIVPLGFTKYQSRFKKSFSKQQALEIIDIVKEYQKESFKKFGLYRFQVADEFYLLAETDFQKGQFYDDYPQFYDGIGMCRAFIDEFQIAKEDLKNIAVTKNQNQKILIASGEGFAPILSNLLKQVNLPLDISVLPIKNRYYGGNVNVTGLLVGEDLLNQLPDSLENITIVVPNVVINNDHKLLDNLSTTDFKNEIFRRGGNLVFSDNNAYALIETLVKVLKCGV